MNELISIIIPVYNVEAYLEKCVESVRDQTYQNIEIILVDDQSPDRCGKICDNYEKIDSRVKVIHKKNGGLSDARNAGLSIAKGDYIGFIDSDDWITPNMYDDLYNAINQYGGDISVCCIRKIYSDHVIAQNIYRTKVYSRRKALYELINSSELESFAWNKLYKKELFDGIGFPYGRVFEDLIFAPEVFQRANRVIHINSLCYNYVRRDDSILGVWNLKTQAEFTHAHQDRFEFLKDLWPEFIPMMTDKYFLSLRDLAKCVKKSSKDEISKTLPLFNNALLPFFYEKYGLLEKLCLNKELIEYKSILRNPMSYAIK